MSTLRKGNSSKVRIITLAMFVTLLIVGVMSHGYNSAWMTEVRGAIKDGTDAAREMVKPTSSELAKKVSLTYAAGGSKHRVQIF